MATTKVVLRRERADEKGLAPLFLRITHNRKSSYYALKLNVPLKYWDDSQDRLKPKAPNAQEINSWILQKQSELEKSWVKAQRTNSKIKVHELKDQILGRNKIDFFEVAREDYE